MARLYPLFSSSKGNSYYIGNEKNGILIDCGVSFRRLNSALEMNHIPLEAVQAVFITHEHTDHIQGLKLLTKNTGMPVYGTKRTLQRLSDTDKVSGNSHLIDIFGKSIECSGCEITCFSTPHDAIHSCGYRITTEDDKVCAICTDLGYVTPEVDAALTGCKLVVLESNYDENMLRHGPYPLYLKERILSQNGHLSNHSCGDQVNKLIRQGTTHIILGHLSQDNNRPDIADTTVQSHLVGFTRGRDYLMGVAPVETQGGAVIF
ncbi:MAG: MBL fold metallo-hydrolase [Ruminococcus sp.]|nr:MBL fold metallo-hydrolase [Ruminococcus sp.]